MKEQKRVPKLRFDEFSGEWKIKPFKELVKINQGLQISISERLLEKEEGSLFYITNEFLRDNSDKKYFIKNAPESVICKKNDVLMTRTGNTGKVVTNVEGAFHNNFFKITYPKSIDKNFLVNFLNLQSTQNYILRLAGTSTIPDLNHSDFYRINMTFPSKGEQQKIASFLSLVDNKIAQLQQKKSLLEDYKKGVMQQIFSQKLRFTKEDGSAYPDWEEKRLGELLDYEQPTKYIVESTEYNDAYKTPVLTAGKSFILGYTDEVTNIYSDLPVIIFDDFTMANQFVDFSFKVKSSAMKILRPISVKVNIKFVFEAMQMIRYPKGDEHKRFWIAEYSKIKIGYPCIEEQTQIAEFLSAIDKKIAVVQTQIEKTQTFKKGLLQQMFV